MSVRVDTFGSGKLGDDKIAEAVNRLFDLRPAAIIERFDMRKPIYAPLAAYGHIGREELGVKWEALDYVDKLKELLG